MIRRLLCALTYHQWRVVFQSGPVKVMGCARCSKMAMRDYATDHVEIWGS